ncbi:MAG TPA: MBOAT family protein, partial [Candidatus Dormibacteraeota bacterium]|nr:MBOAT family protein [Candidatus Dormibacteraeota bacterium]
CLLLAGVTVGNQLAATRIARLEGRRRRSLLAVTIAADLGVLGYFKYAGFFASSFVNALQSMGLGTDLPLVQVALPIGVSFFTFQAISYVVDVNRGVIQPGRLLDVAVFLSFFPHVVAGPIVRAAEFLPQLRRRRDTRRVDATRALCLIVGGLAKKVVLASFLSTAIVDPVFSEPQAHTGLEALMAVYGYAVQIWADFSGYTDIAIGCALLLGIRFPQNFNNPYAASSLQDFWHRWHMTLSRWLRDYLYIPLGGSRGTRALVARNLMITMVLGGLWHGAAWTFVVWGALHGTFLVVERRIREHRAARLARGTAARRAGWPLHWLWPRLLTFHLVCLAWVFFRADSVGDALAVLGRIVGARGPAPLVTPAVVLAVAAGLAVQWVPRDLGPRLVAALSRLAPAAQGAGLAASLAVIGALGPQGVAPFIYYRF